jgi:4-amino-4-deoxy-L-arabinose transferase-like glycosyltransferase
VPWALNTALAAASLLLLFTSTRRLDGPLVAWLATGLTALSPFFVAQSTIYFSHALALFLTLVVFVALEARDRSPHPARWWAAAGLAAGYSINVSPFVTVPLLVVAFMRWRAARRSRPASRGEVLAFASPLVAGVVAFCLVNAATTGDPLVPPYSLNTEWGVRAGFGEGVGEGSYTPEMALVNTRDRLVFLNRIALGWPVSSFLVALPYAVIALAGALGLLAGRSGARGGGGRAPRLRDRWDAELAALLVVTVIAYAFWFFPATDETMGPRYFYAALPTVSLFTARGLAGLGGFLRRGRAGLRPPARLATLVPLALVVVLTIIGPLPYLRDLARNPLSRWRRATHEFLNALDRDGIRAGTIFVEAPWENTLAASLLYASGFDETRPLVFAMDRGPEEDARFLASRGAGPVYYVKPRMPVTEWKLHDRPVWERQGSPSP